MRYFIFFSIIYLEVNAIITTINFGKIQSIYFIYRVNVVATFSFIIFSTNTYNYWNV